MKRGFTLIEVLVIMVIIGILSSVVLSSLHNARQKACQKGNYEACGEKDVIKTPSRN